MKEQLETLNQSIIAAIETSKEFLNGGAVNVLDNETLVQAVKFHLGMVEYQKELTAFLANTGDN